MINIRFSEGFLRGTSGYPCISGSGGEGSFWRKMGVMYFL
jgi:hypothetical protein